MSAEQLTELTVNMSQPWDVAVIDIEVSHGIVVVGMAQAGKTTLTRLVERTWKSFDDEAQVLNFSNSDGFRGFAATALQHSNHSFDQPVNTDVFSDQLEGFIASLTSDEIDDLFDELYASPLQKDILRNPAVNTAVGTVASHQVLRHKAEKSSADRLKAIIEDPGLIKQELPPSLVLLDSRCQSESLSKFAHAGIKSIGTFVLTCDEAVIVERNPAAGSIQHLQARNKEDRERPYGPMTLPEDLQLAFNLADIYDRPETLYAAGILISSIHDSGLHIDTALVSEAQEATAMPTVLSGMLAAA